jgi:hypothetical protein
LGLAELLITIGMAQLLLGEHLTTLQWVGAVMLSISLVLVGFDRITPQKRNTTGWLAWLNPPKISAPDVPWSSRL